MQIRFRAIIEETWRKDVKILKENIWKVIMIYLVSFVNIK